MVGIIDADGLDRPEDSQGNVVDSSGKDDKHNGPETARDLDQSAREKRPFSEVHLPDHEEDHYSSADAEGADNLGRSPGVVLSTPEEPNEEDDQASEAQDYPDEIDPAYEFLPRETSRIDPRRWVIEDCNDDQSDSIPDSDQGANPPPAYLGQQLSIKSTRSPRDKSSDHSSTIESSFGSGNKLCTHCDRDKLFGHEAKTCNSMAGPETRRVGSYRTEDHSDHRQEHSDNESDFATE